MNSSLHSVSTWRSWGLVVIAAIVPGCEENPVPAPMVISPTAVRELASTPAPVAEYRGVVLQPAVVDLGDVDVSQKGLAAEFRLDNRGDRRIRLASLTSSCGCTTPVPEKVELQAGESTRIIALVSPPRQLGRNGAMINVHIDGFAQTLVGQIAWNARSRINVAPNELHFRKVFTGQSVNAELQLSTDDGSDSAAWIGEISVAPEELFVSERTDSGKTTRLAISMSAPIAPGRGRGAVTITCREPVGQIRVPILWEAVDKVWLEPAGVYRGLVPPGDAWKFTGVVRAVSGEEIVHVESGIGNENVQVTAALVNSNTWLVNLSGKAPTSGGPFRVAIPVHVQLAGGEIMRTELAVTGIVRAVLP